MDARGRPDEPAVTAVRIQAGDVVIDGDLLVPADAAGLVIFAHGSGSSRFSHRNRAVASALQAAGFATLLLDLLTPAEESVDEFTREYRFDIERLGRRVVAAVDWALQDARVSGLPIACFGASTGAAAALIAAAVRPAAVRAVDFSRRAPRSREPRPAGSEGAHAARRRWSRRGGHRNERAGEGPNARLGHAGDRAWCDASVRGAGHDGRGDATREPVVSPTSPTRAACGEWAIVAISSGGREMTRGLRVALLMILVVPQPAGRAQMRAHFDQALVLHAAVIRGDLAAVGPAARTLADQVVQSQSVSPALASSRPLAALADGARKVAQSRTILAAAIETAGMLSACGRCHRAAGVTPAFPAPRAASRHRIDGTHARAPGGGAAAGGRAGRAV